MKCYETLSLCTQYKNQSTPDNCFGVISSIYLKVFPVIFRKEGEQIHALQTKTYIYIYTNERVYLSFKLKFNEIGKTFNFNDV